MPNGIIEGFACKTLLVLLFIPTPDACPDIAVLKDGFFEKPVQKKKK